MDVSADDADTDASTGQCYAFLPSEYGEWVHYAFGMRTASKEGAEDGFMRIYIDGELALAMEGLDSGADDGENGFDRGYLPGYHNSACEEMTTFCVTDFMFGTSSESVGLDPDAL